MLLRHRLAAVLAVLTLVSPAAAAQASPKPLRHITLAAARAALPGRVTGIKLPLIDGGITHVSEGLPGCHIPEISLDARGTAYADYRGTDGPDTALLHVDVHVYSTTAQTQAVEQELSRDQLNCPRTSAITTPSAQVQLIETVQTRYTVGAWTGLRKLDHEVLTTSAAGTQRFRVFQIWLTRGNVLMYMFGRITDSPGRGSVQWHWVQEAQAQVLTALNS
jgi:hypothetical protein